MESVQDLIKQLREHPEWRDDLRRELLTDAVLSLPEQTAGLAQAQRQTEQQLTTLISRVDALTIQMETLGRRMDALVDQLSLIGGHVEWLKGDAIERRYRERAAAYFGRAARRIHTLTQDEIEDILDQAIDSGTLTEAEAGDIRLADAVVRGRRPEGEVYFVVEASWGAGLKDVERASMRAGLLSKAGLQTLATVAGVWITPEAQKVAPQMEVWQVTDGKITPPSGRAA